MTPKEFGAIRPDPIELRASVRATLIRSHDSAPARADVWVAVVALIAVTVVVAWSRVGLFDLPSVPSTLTAEQAGLGSITHDRISDDFLRGSCAGVAQSSEDFVKITPGNRAIFARNGMFNALEKIEKSQRVELGLKEMRDRISVDPENVVFANVYRMEVFSLRRDFLNDARKRGELTPKFPPYLDRQPIAFFEELVREHPSRETKLQLALAWVDEMLLFPALEIKAPSSVEAVKILTDVIDNGNEYYVPALFARGLNHLHRPARLVWPEADKTPPDAAARDIGLCVAIGRKVGGGSPRLQATLAMTLGDAYVKAGRLSVARSWWQIAQNLCRDDDIQQGVRRRYGWRDEEILDRLEDELDRARTELDHPMTDLALMWN